MGKKHYRTVWADKACKTVALIDQNKLPFSFKVKKCKSVEESARAIELMTVRGAGAIGATAGFAMAQAFATAPKRNPWKFVEKARKRIKRTRPTAVDLFHATDRVYYAAKKSSNPVKSAAREAHAFADENAEAGRLIGLHGEKLIKNGFKVQTHCNAGWLAFVDWGSALAPIYAAKRKGKKLFVFADETRPRGQGARLTAWELANEKIPHAIIPDNAGAFFQSKGDVDLVIVGADRIVANGDFANKIGTLQVALCAKEFNVPFYVAAPTSTIDLKTKSGKGIKIEQRSE
ncbi:MAG: S-methyl-5-thioribose-1-phosphate isomerase, partial [Candidatus Micrarchaeia archaeon]